LKLIKNVKALSKLSIIILLITSLIIGALLSYLLVMGYYLTLGINIPKNTTLSISHVAFTNQSTSYFNVTFFNPSYSPSAARITKITVKTADNKLHTVNQTSPETPYTIPKANSTTFQCMWNWANYTGQDIGVIAFIDDGSGPTREVRTPFVGLTITETRFNSSISLTHFNLTVQNSKYSATYVNISQIALPTGTLPLNQTSPNLPYRLEKNQSKTFKCNWDWTNYQNKSITIAVRTVEGYTAYYDKTTPQPLGVEITNLVFSEPDTTHFNVTVRNRKESPTFVNINNVTVTLENRTVREINRTQITPAPPYKLDRNSSVTLYCSWNWSLYWGKNATVSIFTTQNYTVRYSKFTPSPIEITNAIFDAANTNVFNITVHNSALYYTGVRITEISLTFENGTVEKISWASVRPPLPSPVLNQSLSMTFKCLWNWGGYQDRNLTITVRTAEDYVAQFVKVTPKRVTLTIASISFDSTDTGIFKVTIRNSVLSLEDANITKVTVTFENGTVKQVSSVAPWLPYLLSPNSTATFTCQWDWTNYRGKNITVTIYAEKGYVAFSLYTTPPIQ